MDKKFLKHVHCPFEFSIWRLFQTQTKHKTQKCPGVELRSVLRATGEFRLKNCSIWDKIAQSTWYNIQIRQFYVWSAVYYVVLEPRFSSGLCTRLNRSLQLTEDPSTLSASSVRCRDAREYSYIFILSWGLHLLAAMKSILTTCPVKKWPDGPISAQVRGVQHLWPVSWDDLH